MKQLDILIVGGGPIGIACGLEAKKNNLNYVIIEKGCIANSLFNYPINMQFFSTSEKLEIDGIPFISNENKPRRAEALEYYRRIVVSNNLNINLFEKVNGVIPQEDYFEINTDKGAYKANNIIIASGFYDIPKTINAPGEDLPKVSHYYKDPHFYAGQELAIVGASNSAVDAALECYRKGAKVSMIVRGDEIGKRVKYWVRPDMINRIEEGSIKAYFKSTVKEIKTDALIIDTSEGEKSIPNDFVLALTGYNPNFNFLRQLGVKLSDDDKLFPQYNPETMESNVNNLYLAGVICGGTETHKWFIENSRIHANIIIKNILEQWLSNLKVYDNNRLYHKPTSEQWCLAELYDHIIKVAWAYQMPNLYKCIHKRPVQGKPKNIKGFLVFNLNFVPYQKIKISSFPKDIQTDFAPEIKDKQELISEFEDFIKDIINISDLLNTSDLSVKNHHPFFGMINAREWYSLVEIHMRHHNRQKQFLEKIKL